MTNEDNILIVPWDFTKIAGCALEHAFRIGNHIKSKIQLLHIISGQINSQEVKNKEEKLEKIIEKAKKDHNADINYQILGGNIFHTISDYAEEKNAKLVIMGTHGIKGMQKIFGSYAYKVLLGSKVPFIIVKGSPDVKKEYTDIVLPIDLKYENMEKMESAAYFGKYFNSKIHIFKAPANNSTQE